MTEITAGTAEGAAGGTAGENMHVFYSLAKVYEKLINIGYDSFIPFIESYLKGRVIILDRRRKKTKDRMASLGGAKCITREDLEHILENIIEDELAPEVADFSNAIYHKREPGNWMSSWLFSKKHKKRR